jgi:radical SAM protein with 4Fe4S-binding SPASM domain
MSNRHFNILVDQAVELGADVISIFGYGEPLMDSGIINKVAYCTKRGLDTFITTNCSLLGVDKATLLLKAGLKKIRFSFHGVHKNYDKVHKGLRFDDSVRNFTNFVAKNRVRYDKQCKVAMTVIPMNGESIEEIRTFWEHGVDELEIWEPHGWGSDTHREVAKERKKTCGRPHSGPLQIQADGQVIPCCFLTNGEIILGNTHKNTIKEILKGDLYKKIRKQHHTGNVKGLPCETCDQLNIGDNPLLYSSVDASCSIGKTSSTKFNLEEGNDLHTEEN